jgi:hypothetical protein
VETAAPFLLLALLVAVWFFVAKKLKARSWFVRHVGGCTLGVFSFFAGMVLFFETGVIKPDHRTEPSQSIESSQTAGPAHPVAPPVKAVATEKAADIPAPGEASESKKSSDVVLADFTVTSDEYLGKIKRTVEVVLKQRISESELTEIAKALKGQANQSTERTFIGYRIGSETGAYWATTHYDPDLDVRIIGMTAAEYEAAQAAPAASFSSIKEAVEDDGDFDEGNGTFEIISDNPLHARFSPRIFKGDHADVIDEELKRAVIYGVYTAFVHTEAESVKISSTPMVVTIKPVTATLQNTPKLEISITRSQALDAVKKFIPVKEASELVEQQGTDGFYYTTWTPAFTELRYQRLHEFFTELQAQSAR